MAVFTLNKFVAAPQEVVFDYASDFANAADHINGITRMEMLTNGPVGVGTRFKETRIMFKREATEEMEVIAFDKPRSYALGCESCGCRYRTDFRFDPSDAGTNIEMRFEATPLTMMAKIMSVIFRPMLKACVKACENDLNDIKAVCESRAG